MRRRTLLLATALAAATHPAAAEAPMPLYTAGPGSAFLPYGEALAAFLARRGVTVEVRRSAGSIENLRRVETEPGAIATAFLGTVADALAGTPAFDGRPHRALRALAPMYETGFMAVALAGRGIRGFADLAGRRVGCGPARGPAEQFFRLAAEAAGISAEVVSGASDALGEAVLRGELDALWQGAIVPVPALAAVADRAEAVVFGPGPEASARVLARLPHLAPLDVPPGAYRGQAAPIASFAGWNFLVGNAALPAAAAERLVAAVLSARDPAAEIGPMAGSTRAANAGRNRVLAFHPGAAAAIRAAGGTVPEIAPPA
jgi:TRAP transporter TAXI family solute receptor